MANKFSVTFNGDTTVEQLIAALQTFDPKAIVIGPAHNFELNGADIPVSGLYLREFVKEDRTFRDAFDGDSYNKTIFKMVTDEKKGIQCVYISI